MPDKINLTGRWRFQEDFGYGKDSGYAELSHTGSRLEGILRFVEQIGGEETFIVKQEFTGKISGKKVVIRAHSCEILYNTEDVVYELDSWEGQVNSNGMIVGVSRDAEGTKGQFTMERESFETPELKGDHIFGQIQP